MTRAFKAMAEAINSELLHQGQALGDMFGGGGASLIDILGRVNQELENEGYKQALCSSLVCNWTNLETLRGML
ncbi:hypothetical protein QNE90_003892 [Vibrio alginolyticus]|nr:hypothetical protein [Vibrio alginolyticus]